jgi:hypothetical protein
VVDSEPGSVDTILAGGEPKETVVQLRRPASAPLSPLSHTSTGALSRASTEELLLELRRASSPPATHATKPGTTGAAAWTRKATGPNRASSQQQLTDSVPDRDAVCSPVRPRHSSGR